MMFCTYESFQSDLLIEKNKIKLCAYWSLTVNKLRPMRLLQNNHFIDLDKGVSSCYDFALQAFPSGHTRVEDSIG